MVTVEPGITIIPAYQLIPFKKNVPNDTSLGGQFLGFEVVTLIPIGAFNLPINFSYHLLHVNWRNNLNGDRTEKSDTSYIRLGLCPKLQLNDGVFPVYVGGHFGWGIARTTIPDVDNTDGFQSGLDISISISVNLDLFSY